jgi:hypothetical protein
MNPPALSELRRTTRRHTSPADPALHRHHSTLNRLWS